MAFSQGNEEAVTQMLATIASATGGDATRGVSMWKIGESLGLDRARTEDLAMLLVSEGIVEIRSLSGSLTLTEEGRRRVGGKAEPAEPVEPVTLGFLVSRIEEALPGMNLQKPARTDLELDLAMLKALHARSVPLPAVRAALLAAVKASVEATPRAADLSPLIAEAMGDA